MQAKKVLLPVRGEDSDDEALWLARAMCRETKGTIYVLYVIEVQRSLPLDADVGPESAKGELVLKHMEKLGEQYRCNMEAEILQARDAGPAVVQAAVDRKVEAIVMALPYGRNHGIFSLGKRVP